MTKKKTHKKATVTAPIGPSTFSNKVRLPGEDSYWPGAMSALLRSAAGVWQNLVPLLIIVLVYGLTSFGELPKDAPLGEFFLYTYRQVLLAVVLLASTWPVYALAVADDERLGFHEWLSRSLRRYVTALAVTAASVMAVLFSAFLLFIPLIWLVPAMSMAIYIAVDPRRGSVSVLETFREGYRLTSGHKWLVWYILGGMFLMIVTLSVLFSPLFLYVHSPVLPVISKALGSAVTVIASCALGMLYRWLQRQADLDK